MLYISLSMRTYTTSFLFSLLLLSLFACKSNSSNNAEEKEEQQAETPITYTSAVEQYGQLHIDGNTIVDKNNQAVQLRGMSFFWSQWYGQFYRPEVVSWLQKDWQCTIVRAAMAIDDDGGYVRNPEAEKEKIFTVIDAAIEAGIYVIVDWHSHHAESYLEEAKTFFSEVASTYGHLPNIIYEPYNEPLDNVSWDSVIKPYHEEVIKTIRAIDPDNIIVCGNRSWSTQLQEVAENRIEDPNVAYTFHYYAASHKQEMRDIVKQAVENNLPVFVTEFGVTEYTGNGSISEEETQLWWQLLDEYHISWCNWSISDKKELSAALKPGASTTGGWKTSMLTTSGNMIRNELKAKNPKY